MKGNSTLVIGASGLIGGYLYRFLRQAEQKPIGTFSSNRKEGMFHFDLIDSSLDSLPLDNVKHAVICSAIAKVDKCREDPYLSRRVNVAGVERAIIYFSERGILPVFFSSAAVFDGISGNYKETDIKNPTTFYGKQKADVEDFIIKYISEHLIIRPGKVFGLSPREGVLFADWLNKYKKGEEIRCADDEKLSPIYAGDVARGLHVLLEKNTKGIYHMNPQQHYSRFEMAAKFFDYLGIKDAKITRCSIDDFNLLEKRNKNTYLDSSKFIKETGFKFTSLEDCFDIIKNNYSFRT